MNLPDNDDIKTDTQASSCPAAGIILPTPLTENIKTSLPRSSSSPTAMSRQYMRERLYTLIQERCSIKDPKVEANVLEQLIYRSSNGDAETYSKIMHDKSVITSKLKDVETMLLFRRLRKRQKKLGGFRSQMILTKLPVLPTNQRDKPKALRTTTASNLSRETTPVLSNGDHRGSGDDDDSSCYNKIPIASLKITHSGTPSEGTTLQVNMECEESNQQSSLFNIAAV